MKLSTDHLVEALNFVLDQNDLSHFHRKRMKKRVLTAARRGRLGVLDLGPDWAWRICAANLCLGRINHWWGWEARSNVIWELSNLPWQYPRWDGSDCKLYLVAEQGIGDEIFFSQGYRWLLERNPRTTIECDSRLIPAFERTFGAHFESRWKDEVKGRLPTDQDAVPLAVPRGDYDFFMPAGNAVKCAVQQPEDFLQNWIEMDAERVTQWRAWLSQYEPPYVGVSWVGRQGRLDPAIFAGEGTVFNLNYEGTSGFQVPPCKDFDDTWHFIAALDRVESVTNTVIHMAGAVGVPCNVIKAPPMYGEVNNRLQWQFGALSRYFYPLMTVYESERDYLNGKTQEDLGAVRRRGAGNAGTRPATHPHQ